MMSVSTSMRAHFACSSTVEKESSEPEAIPLGKELVGLSFTSVGATDPPK